MCLCTDYDVLLGSQNEEKNVLACIIDFIWMYPSETCQNDIIESVWTPLSILLNYKISEMLNKFTLDLYEY